MDTPKKGYSRSEWSALSIQERIRAMNDTLDTVEASPANMGLSDNNNNNNNVNTKNSEDGEYGMTTGALSSSFSPVQSMLSEEDMAVAADVLVLPKRSSVVDMWRKREEDVAETGTGTAADGVGTASPKKTQTASTARSNKEQAKEQEEKKEQHVDNKEDGQHEMSPAPSAVRNMWSQRVANSPSPVVPKKTVSAVARKSPALPVKPPLTLWDVPADLTIMPPEEETEDSDAEDNKRSPSKVANSWAQRGLQRVRTPSPPPSEAAAAVSPPKNGSKRVSVVDSWQKRKSPQSQHPQQQPSGFDEAPTRAETTVAPARPPVVAIPVSSRGPASPKRSSVADRWAKRMNENHQDSPQSGAATAPDQQSETHSAVSEPSMDPVEHAPAVPAALAVPVSPGSSSRAASPGRSPARAAPPADRWAKRLSERNLDTEESAEEQMPSTSHLDKLKPVKAIKRLGMPEAPSPSALPVEQASPKSKRGNVAKRWPINGNEPPESKNAEELRPVRIPSLPPTRGNVAERWTTNIVKSPIRALHSKSPDVDSIQLSQVDPPGTPPAFYSEKIEGVHPAEHLFSEESVAAKIPQATEPRAVSTVDDVQPNTSAAPKPASLIQAWNRGHSNTSKAVRSAKSLKPPRRNELPNPQVDAVAKDGASFSAFDSWGTGGKQADVDSDASSTASRSDPVRLKKKNLMRMAQKHVSQGIAHKLADSSFTKDDDSTEPGDLSTAADTVTTGSTVMRFGASPLDSPVRKDAKEDRANQEKEESVVEGATLRSPSKAATPSSEKRHNYLPPVIASGKSPRSNKLTVGTVMETISGVLDQEEHEDDKDLTPRTRKVVDSLRQKKKRLQLQRRRMKANYSLDSVSASASASFNSADTGYEQVTPGGASFEQKGISYSSSLPCRDTGSEFNDDLLPIDENGRDSAFPSAYTPLHVSDSNSILLSPGQKARSALSPKSEAGQSDGGFSFYSAASSAHTGISIKSSGSKGSSLANRAEKAVQERRQKWKAGSKDDQQLARELARKVLNGSQNAVSQRMPGEGNYTSPAMDKREGLSTRYNTSSRFIDTDPSYGGAFAQPEPSVGRDHNSFSTAESVDGSEFRSVGSDTTENESEFRAARRRAKKKKAIKYAKEKARAKRKPDYISNGVVSDQFVSESTTNVEAFKSAYEAVSLGQLAADLADEVSLSVNGGGFDFQKIAIDVNDSFRKYCGIKTSNAAPFDDAAEADHTVNTEDEDDPKGDLGAACANIDDAMEFSTTGKSKWNKHPMAPAGQASFEGLATPPSRKGIRAAYV
jgi:hypothetical protein